jgi:hypothetical protein
VTPPIAELYGTVNVDELLFPVGEAGVAVPLLVTAEVATGLVVVQVRVPLVQLLAPIAIVQVEDAGVRVPDMMRAGDTATSILSILVAPLLSVTVKRNVYVPETLKPENVGVRVVPPVIVATDGVDPT